ncbi:MULTISPECIES: GtrA family protein [Rodentibacter]|uniref:GtrA family protein n=1 Tax=Rodentibacter TaxID=1960084 RepID=UPI001CFD1E3E
MFSRYVLVGICNTLLTTIIIFGLTASQFNLYIANAIGYAAGILCSFLLNSIFTFSRPANAANFSRFLVVSLICYILNVKVIYIDVVKVRLNFSTFFLSKKAVNTAFLISFHFSKQNLAWNHRTLPIKFGRNFFCKL